MILKKTVVWIVLPILQGVKWVQLQDSILCFVSEFTDGGYKMIVPVQFGPTVVLSFSPVARSSDDRRRWLSVGVFLSTVITQLEGYHLPTQSNFTLLCSLITKTSYLSDQLLLNTRSVGPTFTTRFILSLFKAIFGVLSLFNYK